MKTALIPRESKSHAPWEETAPRGKENPCFYKGEQYKWCWQLQLVKRWNLLVAGDD